MNARQAVTLERPGGSERTRLTLQRFSQALIAPVAAALISVIVASIALLIAGHNPFDAFRAMWSYVDSTVSVVAILNRATPYYVSALAAAIGFKMGLFNIGVDGQYRLAALLAATAGAAVTLPAVFHVAFIFIVAMGVGAAYAGIAGVLKVTRGVNEVIATIMLNFIATGLIAFMLTRWFKAETTGGGAQITKTEQLPKSAWMPDLNAAFEKIGFHFPANTRLYGYIVVAAILGIAFYLVIWRTRFGFDLRSSGINPFAARASGVKPGRMILITMLMSGAIAGLVGMGPLLSDTHFFEASGGQFPLGLGFTGIGVALLGRNHPAGIALAAFVYAGIERSTQVLSPMGIPPEISRILQGTLILSAVIAYEVVRRYSEAAAVRAASRGIDTHITAEPLVGRSEGAPL
jgi:simple sugar transport system permease protein